MPEIVTFLARRGMVTHLYDTEVGHDRIMSLCGNVPYALRLPGLTDEVLASYDVCRGCDRAAPGHNRTRSRVTIGQVLTLLGTGVKDDVVARELCVSTRTVRRMVGDHMRAIGAKNRFQLGVMAERRRQERAGE